MANSSSSSSHPPGGQRRSQRKLRNFLLDPRFQLKWTGYLMAVTLLVGGALSMLLWRTGREAISESQAAVASAQEAVQVGQQVLKKSQDLSAVVKMNIAEKYSDNPELGKLFTTEAQKGDEVLLARQKKFEQDAAHLLSQSTEISHQQHLLDLTLGGSLLMLALVIGCMGIVVTHKIAGPIYKMKRQFHDLAEGHLRMPSPLRKGDELGSFFAAFEGMVQSLRDRQEREIRRVEEILRSVRENPTDPGLPEELSKLRAEMQAELDG